MTVEIVIYSLMIFVSIVAAIAAVSVTRGTRELHERNQRRRHATADVSANES